MDNKRREEREKGYAKVLIDNQFPGYLRDMSSEGLRIDSLKQIPKDSRLNIKIIPEETIGIEYFTIQGQIAWEKKEGLFNLYGIVFSEQKEEASAKKLLKLAEYYK